MSELLERVDESVPIYIPIIPRARDGERFPLTLFWPNSDYEEWYDVTAWFENGGKVVRCANISPHPAGEPTVFGQTFVIDNVCAKRVRELMAQEAKEQS